MPTSLASQLAKSVSLNAPLLSETARKKHFATSSYLFSANAKGQIDDLDSIFALASNALAQLKQIYASIAIYDENSAVHQCLFSQKARETDRTLLGREEAEEVNKAIASFMRALGPCLLESNAGRIIEWLVRRFRVQEFNVSDVLALFLPYHESPHFAKMVSILTIGDNAPWAFLASYKAAGKPVSRTTLAAEMLKNRDFARFVVDLLPEAFGAHGGINVHRTLLCFNASVLLEYVTRADKKDLDAGTLAFLLPALFELLKVEDEGRRVSAANRKDGILGSYVLLAALSQKCAFTSIALKKLVSAMVHSASATAVVDAPQLITALISLLNPQEALDSLPQFVVDELAHLSDFIRALSSSLGFTGVDKLVLPLLSQMVSSEGADVDGVLEFLLTNPRVPENIVKESALKLVQVKSTKLLAALYQRRPEVLRKAIDELVELHDGDRAELDQLLLDISVPEGFSGAPRDAVLTSTDAEPSVRASTVRHIAKLLSQEKDVLSEEETTSLQNALYARMFDSSPVVLEALYAEQALVTPLISDTKSLSSLSESLLVQSVSRSVFRAHLSFLCNAFYEAHPELSLQVLRDIVLPRALFSRQKYKTAVSVWEIVTASKLGGHKLLKGIKEALKNVIKTAKDDKSNFGTDEMAEANISLANILADNFRTSNDYPALLDWLISNLKSGSDAHKRLLVFLITRQLLKSLSGEHQIDAAFKALQAIDLSEIRDVGKVGDAASLDEGALEDGLLKAIVSKPNSRSTIQKAQFSILARFPAIPRPANVEIDWFIRNDLSNLGCRGIRYLYLMRAVYSSINSTALDPAHIMYINQRLFEQLGSDSLLFLAGVWLHSSDSTKYVALRHASAFFSAHSSETLVDFQTILPALLHPLQSTDKRVREAAVDCIAILSRSTASVKPTAVYAYEQVYGTTSTTLQYLEWPDECKYVNALVEHKEHFISDADHIRAFHLDHLSASKAEGKKDAKQRQRLHCYLLSHIISCRSSALSLALLRSVRYVSDPIKLRMLLPIIKGPLDVPLSTEPDAETAEVNSLALESFDKSSMKELNADDSQSWPVLLSVVRHYHAIGRRTPEWNSSLRSLSGGLFTSLSSKRQLELSLLLADLGTASSDAMGIKHLLVQLLKHSPLICAIMKSLQPSETGQRAAKRQKGYTSTAGQEDTLPRLTLLAEVLSTQELPGSLELVSVLLDTLARTLASATVAQADLIYAEQLLMTCVESVASQVEEMPNLSPNAIRLDVLVDIMRASDNPQTFHQALLLMASLARLAPDSVLRNVMPIFTFMGSNVFHRDDSYSFKVIQKTTESIVPVVTASLKEKHTDRVDLYIGAREFLRTFTDAANHIPRHRRTNFFTHLVNVLGPREFLAPIIMLLADKLSNRVTKQDISESQTTLTLPLSAVQHYELPVQIATAKEVLREVRDIFSIVQESASNKRTFLEVTLDEDQPTSLTMLRKRQCQTLLILVGCCFKQMTPSQAVQDMNSDMSVIISALLEFALLDGNDEANTEFRDVGSASRWALLQTLKVISTTSFVRAINDILLNPNKKVQIGALELLAQRVPLMKAEAREDVSSTMDEIITKIKEILTSSQDLALANESMHALSSIVESAGSKEESALLAVLPIILESAKRPEVSSAMTSVSPMVTKLGPRIISHLRHVVSTCSLILRSGSSIFHQESVSSSLKALTSALKAVPGFWGQQELKTVIELYLELDQSAAFAAQFDKLIKLIAKDIPSKVLISALFQSWPTFEVLSRPNGQSMYSRFFELLKRCLHSAKRSDVLENLKTFFTNFLNAFDIRTEATADVVQLENSIIAAYTELVVKLNEAAFQPLFRKFCDWAFGDETFVTRKITFCRAYSALLDLFKELMTPYMQLFMTNFVDLLVAFQKGQLSDSELWLASVEMLSKDLSSDDGTFWRNQKLRCVAEPTVQQIPVCISLRPTDGKILLSECLTSLVGCIDDDSLLQSTNRSILVHTRSDDARVRLFALSCAVAVWSSHGRKLGNLGPETATFIIECAEDENDDVVRECHRLKDAVEREVGKIEGL